MKSDSSRRSFFKTTGAAALVTSLEEFHLLAQETSKKSAPVPAIPAHPKASLAEGTIGKVKISRLICGGNLITGYAHSRDLIYVSNLLKAYFTEAKIMETWARCEEHGINTMIFHPSDQTALKIYHNYRRQGGKIQFLAQLDPPKNDLNTLIRTATDAGAVGALLVGNYGDTWTRDGDLDHIAQFIELVKAQSMIAGIAGHELRTPMAVEKAGIKPDFYMKTFHSNNYWSGRKPDQLKEVIDNYGIDNYWCLDPDGTARFFAELDRPWIAYKVLAAGAIPPRAGFMHAFESGADFCVVGMFDFQIAENVGIANEVLAATRNRARDWMA